MKSLCYLALFFFPIAALAQFDKKLEKQFQSEVKQLPVSNQYPSRPTGKEVKFYPSTTVREDTTGASNEHEFLLFRQTVPTGEVAKFIKTSYVSNNEYQEFIDWVLDSVKMEQIYVNHNIYGHDKLSDDFIASMLIHPDVYIDPETNKEVVFNPSKPLVNRALFYFNYDGKWRKKISDKQMVPAINDLYLSPFERFYKRKQIDERHLVYVYGEDNNYMVIATPDRDVWAQNSAYPYDFLYNLANHYSRSESYQHLPVIGLLGTQVQAYLHYKQRMLQQQLNEKGLDYEVVLTLPTQQELEQGDIVPQPHEIHFIRGEKNMRDQWQIKNYEYWEFLSWVQDSILRERIYRNYESKIDDEVIANFLNYVDIYYDEVDLTWHEFDPSDLSKNRELWSFDYDFKWKRKIESAKFLPLIQELFNEPDKIILPNGDINHRDFKPSKYFYTYYWEDLGRRAQLGKLRWFEEEERYYPEDDWVGRDLDLSGLSKDPQYNSGIRRHRDYNIYIIDETIGLYPGIECEYCTKLCEHEYEGNLEAGDKEKCPDGSDKTPKEYDFWSQPDRPVQGITYRQALAYYHWRYQKQAIYNKTELPLYNDLVPTEEQFKRVQKGEQIVEKEKSYPYPTPRFRYVIHVYPKG